MRYKQIVIQRLISNEFLLTLSVEWKYSLKDVEKFVTFDIGYFYWKTNVSSSGWIMSTEHSDMEKKKNLYSLTFTVVFQ
jgi:long-subunit fatty acid transport protein